MGHTWSGSFGGFMAKGSRSQKLAKAPSPGGTVETPPETAQAEANNEQ